MGKKDFSMMLNPVVEEMYNEDAGRKAPAAKEEAREAASEKSGGRPDADNREKKIPRSLLLPASTYHKIVKIASMKKMSDPESRVSFTTVVIEALGEYISAYEKRNGKIE